MKPLYCLSFFVLLGLFSACSHTVNIPGENANSSVFEGVPCGEARCDKGQSCHFFYKNGPICVGEKGVPKDIQENDQAGASMGCDGPEDCDSPKECAYMIRALADYGVQLLCTANRDVSWNLVCHTSNDCPSSHPICRNVKKSFMGSFSYCDKTK